MANKNVSWSIMFKVSKFRSSSQEQVDKMWSVIRSFDKLDPVAFCEFAYDEDVSCGWGYDWYSWHHFMSRAKLEKAIKAVFEALDDVDYIEIYKDTITGCFCDGQYRGLVRREV